jgi:predicted phage baseplate assembly protein
VYRNGIGKPGNVRAGQISQLSTRPLGVKDVVNPLRASGGADPESRDAARRNTPNAVMALDRLVSTRDYADFARAFAGIGKAASVELPDGANTVVHVTIAGADDIPIDPSSDLYRGLRGALRRLGDPFQPLVLATRELLILVISAKVRIDADRRWEVVAAALRARLMEAFGFERRDLAQPVASSEVLSVMQAVPGVAWVDLDSFGAVPTQVADPDAEGGIRALTPEEIAAAIQAIAATAVPPAHVAAATARPAPDGVGILAAQLAILLPDAPDTLVLTRIE